MLAFENIKKGMYIAILDSKPFNGQTFDVASRAGMPYKVLELDWPFISVEMGGLRGCFDYRRLDFTKLNNKYAKTLLPLQVQPQEPAEMAPVQKSPEITEQTFSCQACGHPLLYFCEHCMGLDREQGEQKE